MPAEDFRAEVEAQPVLLPIDDERLARLNDPARQAFAVLQRHQLVAVLIREVDDAAGPVEQRHVGDVRLEDGTNLFAHEFEQGSEVELARKLLRHGVDGGQLGGALLRFGEQACILDGDRRLQRKPDQEFQLAVAKRLSRGAPNRHHTLHGLSGQQRRHHQPLILLLLRAGDQNRTRVGTRIVDKLGAAALDETADDALAHFDHHRQDLLGDVADRDDRPVSLPARIGQEDGAAGCVEQALGMTGDAVHHRRQVQRRGNVATDFGERGGLARATLRLVEQPRVLERHAHGVGERLQQAHVRFAVRVLMFQVDQADEPARLIAGDQRHVDRGFVFLGTGQREASVLFRLLHHVLVDYHRLAGAQNVARKPLVG